MCNISEENRRVYDDLEVLEFDFGYRCENCGEDIPDDYDFENPYRTLCPACQEREGIEADLFYSLRCAIDEYEHAGFDVQGAVDMILSERKR